MPAARSLPVRSAIRIGSRGSSDTIALLRDAARPQTVEHRAPSAAQASLDAAIDAFAAGLRHAPATPADIASRLSDLTQKADAHRRLRTAWSRERGDAAEADITVWAEALRASTHAHRQEIDVLMPWASLLAPARLIGDEAAALLDTITDLGRAAGRTAKRYRGCWRSARRQRGPRALDGGAGTIRRRGPIAVISPCGDGRSRENHVRWHGIRLPVRSRPPAAVHRLSRQRWHVSMPISTICWRPKRGWRASSPSPRAMCPPSTGSGSDAP